MHADIAPFAAHVVYTMSQAKGASARTEMDVQMSGVMTHSMSILTEAVAGERLPGSGE